MKISHHNWPSGVVMCAGVAIVQVLYVVSSGCRAAVLDVSYRQVLPGLPPPSPPYSHNSYLHSFIRSLFSLAHKTYPKANKEVKQHLNTRSAYSCLDSCRFYCQLATIFIYILLSSPVSSCKFIIPTLLSEFVLCNCNQL